MTAPPQAYTLDDLSIPTPPRPNGWSSVQDGVVIVPGLIPDELIDQYESEWKEANGFERVDEDGVIHAARRGGFNDTDYMRYPSVYALATYGPLGAEIEKIIGEPAGVHLGLTGWVSTERDYHQDGYLNEECVGDYYAAVWIALGDVHPDSGPFQYIPGSQRWGRTITKEKIGQVVDLRNPMWPKHSEDVLSPIITAEIAHRAAQVATYLPKKGDVLIWDPLVFHRGSAPVQHGAYRPSAIFHYSGLTHRTDMPPAQQAPGGGWAFPLGTFGF